MAAVLKLTALGLLATIVACSAFMAGFIINYLGVPPRVQAGQVVVPAKFPLMWEVWGHLKDEYYGTIPETPALVHGMIRGMLQSLGDSHTILVEPQPAKLEQNTLQGNYGGIGARIEAATPVGVPAASENFGFHIILLPFADGPAAKAGIFANDYVVKIDDKNITPDLTPDDVDVRLRGDVGSTVNLTIYRIGETSLRTFVITRAQINIPTVESRMLPNTTVAYVRITLESGDTAKEFQDALNSLKRNNPSGVILDLRNNPGGIFPDPVLAVAGEFLGAGSPVVLEHYRDGSEKTYSSTGSGLAKDMKLVVLVNGGTASDAEVLAGALQDNGRGILLGEKTFGKGSVQELRKLRDESVLHVTVATWFTPKHNGIDGVGLKPDLAVPLTSDDSAKGLDPQIDRAVEYIKNGS